jgi:hypothetical protein
MKPLYNASSCARALSDKIKNSTCTEMYLRFATTRRDDDSRKPQGVFAAAYALSESGDLGADECKRVREILIWFNKNLTAPPAKFSARRAIFWFKSGARPQIQMIWELVHLLREHGHHIEVHKCRHLANICYEDKLQVAAYPATGDSKTTKQ